MGDAQAQGVIFDFLVTAPTFGRGNFGEAAKNQGTMEGFGLEGP